MIAFSSMLLEPARVAGMKVPADADEFDAEQYPHFNIYLQAQVGASLPYPSAHWDNAKVIAALTDEEVNGGITWGQLFERLNVGRPIP